MQKILVVLLLDAVLMLVPACECGKASDRLIAAPTETEVPIVHVEPELQALAPDEVICVTNPVTATVTVPAMKYYDVPLDEELQEYTQCVAGNYGIEYELVLAVIMTESSCKLDAIGDGGLAIGLMQVQPQWWQELIDYWKLDVYQTEDNVRLGVMILSECLLENDGDVKRALKQYNSGNPDYPSDEYYNKVMEHMNNLQEVNYGNTRTNAFGEGR